jgi:hypothetical protein
MLMREKPFIGDDAFATALQHINEPPPKLSDEFSHYQGLLDRLLAKIKKRGQALKLTNSLLQHYLMLSFR